MWNIILNSLTLNNLTMGLLTIIHIHKNHVVNIYLKFQPPQLYLHSLPSCRRKIRRLRSSKQYSGHMNKPNREKTYCSQNLKYNEQCRDYSLKLLQKNEKLKGKHDKVVVGIKRLQKLVRNWRVEASKHLSHISLLNKKLKERSNPAGGQLNIVVNAT